MNNRTCIVTGETHDADQLLRFVADPASCMVVDLKRNLPGRGVWVSGTREHVKRAVAKRLFARGLKRSVTAADDLADQVERLLSQQVLFAIALARKAGTVVNGHEKVLAAIAGKKATIVFHATDGAKGGFDKIFGAVRRSQREGRQVTISRAYDAAQLGKICGRDMVVNLAVVSDRSAKLVGQRLAIHERYCGPQIQASPPPDGGR